MQPSFSHFLGCIPSRGIYFTRIYQFQSDFSPSPASTVSHNFLCCLKIYQVKSLTFYIPLFCLFPNCDFIASPGGFSYSVSLKLNFPLWLLCPLRPVAVSPLEWVSQNAAGVEDDRGQLYHGESQYEAKQQQLWQLQRFQGASGIWAGNKDFRWLWSGEKEEVAPRLREEKGIWGLCVPQTPGPNLRSLPWNRVPVVFQALTKPRNNVNQNFFLGSLLTLGSSWVIWSISYNTPNSLLKFQ